MYHVIKKFIYISLRHKAAYQEYNSAKDKKNYVQRFCKGLEYNDAKDIIQPGWLDCLGFHCVAQWQSVGVVIERLLTPGSIPKLAMRRFVLGKDSLRFFRLGPSTLPVMVAQPDERLANRTHESALRWCSLTQSVYASEPATRTSSKTGNLKLRSLRPSAIQTVFPLCRN